MTRLAFRNRLCILRSIDRHELVEGGVLGAADFTTWNTFVNDPVRFFLLCEDHRAEKIWMVIERRTIDWCNASDAIRAFRSGILPPVCSINADGALVIPEADRPIRGSTVIIEQFDRVVTTSGRIVKDRDGALKAARAL